MTGPHRLRTVLGVGGGRPDLFVGGVGPRAERLYRSPREPEARPPKHDGDTRRTVVQSITNSLTELLCDLTWMLSFGTTPNPHEVRVGEAHLPGPIAVS